MSELIVLFGEADYSFALDFVRILRSNRLLDSTYEVLASDLNAFDATTSNIGNSHYKHRNDSKTQDNIRKLILDYGVRIWTDVDARNLHNHPRLVPDLKLAINLKRVHFIFNFLHVQTTSMRVDLNRSLLRDTFMSIEDLSRTCSVEVIIYVSLHYGQSDINAVESDHHHRSWSDSWKLIEMASYGNFVLVNNCPFSSKSFKKLFCDNVAREQSIFDSNKKFWMATYHENKENLLRCTTSEDLSLLNEEFESYHPFDYQQQPKLLRSSKKVLFECGNIFVFEHRDFKIDCFIPRIIYTHPFSSNSMVQKFIDDIGEIILDNIAGCRSVKPYLIERSTVSDHSTEPIDLYILNISLIDSSPQSQFRTMSNIIGRYLKKSYVEDLLTEDLRIDDISFGFWSKDEHSQRLLSLNLLVENCLRIKWQIIDIRILYSKYFHIIENPSEMDQKIPTTGSLYPQIYHRDISFWWQGVADKMFPQNEFFRMVWDHFQPTNLRSIQLKEKYIKSMEPIMISYCFRLVIQSVDLALDRQKVHDLITTLGIRMMTQFPQIKMR